MATFLLIHGAWQAGWCWREIVPPLAQHGHQAMTLDLPGHGDDHHRAADVTLQDYVDVVGRAIQEMPDKPIVVVHSWGGILCAVGEAFADRIAALVFIAAAIPPNGESMMRVVEEYDPEVSASFVFSEDGRTATITLQGAREFLYGLGAAELVEDAIPRLTAEPVAPFETPIVTSARFERVPRYYVEALRDRGVPPRVQKAIQARMGFRRVFSLESDHSPFFSTPKELVACLLSVAVDI